MFSPSKIHLVRLRICSKLERKDASRGRQQFFCNQERSMLEHHTHKGKKKSGNVNVNVFVPQAGGGSHNRRTETAAYLVRHCEIKRNKKCERRQ